MAGGRGVDHGPQINNCVTFVFYKEKNLHTGDTESLD